MSLFKANRRSLSPALFEVEEAFIRRWLLSSPLLSITLIIPRWPNRRPPPPPPRLRMLRIVRSRATTQKAQRKITAHRTDYTTDLRENQQVTGGKHKGRQNFKLLHITVFLMILSLSKMVATFWSVQVDAWPRISREVPPKSICIVDLRRDLRFERRTSHRGGGGKSD